MLLGSGKVKNTTQSSNNHNPSVCSFILGKQALDQEGSTSPIQHTHAFSSIPNDCNLARRVLDVCMSGASIQAFSSGLVIPHCNCISGVSI